MLAGSRVTVKRPKAEKADVEKGRVEKSRTLNSRNVQILLLQIPTTERYPRTSRFGGSMATGRLTSSGYNIIRTCMGSIRNGRERAFVLDPETGPQALRSLFFLLFLLLSVLKLFHLTADRRQTSHTHW